MHLHLKSKEVRPFPKTLGQHLNLLKKIGGFSICTLDLYDDVMTQ